MKHSPHAEEYRRRVAAIRDSLQFFESLAGSQAGEIRRVDYFTSHEGLHLLYEQAQTRRVPRRAGWYNLSTHFPWIGMRTAQLGGAHVEYFRGISNPIAVKVGAGVTPAGLVELVGRARPLPRAGAPHLHPPLRPQEDRRRAAAADRGGAAGRGARCSGCAIPCTATPRRSPSGLKTRRFDHILSELQQAFDLHEELGSYLGGVHFELTGEDVTECMGGARGLTEEDLQRAYRSQVDPRLNYEQALEMALLIARRMGRANS